VDSGPRETAEPADGRETTRPAEDRK
jgi:hypothetical protein